LKRVVVSNPEADIALSSRLIDMRCYILHAFLYAFLTILLGCEDSTDSSDKAYNGLVTIEGGIEVVSDTNVDQDVEGICTTLSQKNNTFANAQLISNPLTIGGYLNGDKHSQGECLDYEEDIVDFYRVALVQDQLLSLSIFPAHEDRLDLDVSLILRRVDSPEIIISELNLYESGAKSLTVLETAEYYVAVRTKKGMDAVLYTLALTLNLSTESVRMLSHASKFDFVPGEVLIVNETQEANTRTLKTPAHEGSNTDQSGNKSDQLTTKHSLRFKKSIGKRSGLFTFKDMEHTRYRISESSNWQENKGQKRNQLEQKWKTLELISELNKDGSIGKAEPNYYRKPAFVPNDEFYETQWNLSLMSMEAAWDRSTGHDVVVAVIDSGVNFDHPELVSQVTTSGYDFIASTDISGDGDGYDSDPTDLSEAQHGTHVAGIIAARGDNQTGIAGVAFNSRIMPLRVLGVEGEDGESQGTDADLVNAILYAGGIENESGQLPDRAADIINLSLGGGGNSSTLRDAIEAVIAKGIIVIAAAGNEASAERFYPAAYDGVISVSAINEDLALSEFSNFGDSIDIAAPGGERSVGGILSTVADNGYVQYYGTSMAAPHVAGVAALMKSVNQELNTASFSHALETGFLTDVIGEASQFGAGLVNANKAVAWASGDQDIPDSLYFYPKSFSFVKDSVDAKLYLSNPGNGTVRVVSIASNEGDESWLDVTQDVVDDTGLGVYNIEINSAAIPINTFKQGSLTITYQVNTEAEEQVSLNVLASNTISGNESVGNLYISLIALDDVVGNEADDAIYPVAETAGSLENGVYRYRFTNIPVGEYFVRASTNNDGDQYLFDEGEAIGLYPSVSLVNTVKADQRLIEDVDFSVKFYESRVEVAQYPSVRQRQ
jgi:serine protease